MDGSVFRAAESRLQLTVGFAAVADSIDHHELVMVIDREEDAVVTDSQAVAFDASELLDTWTAGSLGELRDALKQRTPLRFGNRAEIFLIR